MVRLEHINIIDTEKLFVIEAKGRTWKLKLQPEQKEDFYQLMNCIGDNDWQPNPTQQFFYDFLKQNDLLNEIEEIPLTHIECIYGPTSVLEYIAKHLKDFTLEGSLLRNINPIKETAHTLYLEVQRNALYLSNESFSHITSNHQKSLFLEYVATVFVEKIKKISINDETVMKVSLTTFNNEITYLRKTIDCHHFFESIAAEEGIGGTCSIDNERFFPFSLATYLFQNNTYVALGNSEKDAINNLLFHLKSIYPVTFSPLTANERERDLIKLVYAVYFKENMAIEETADQYLFKTNTNATTITKTKHEINDLMLGFTELLKERGAIREFRTSTTVN